MMRGLLLAAILAAPIPALALTDPSPGALDSRVRVVDYKPMQVVRLCSTGLTPITLILDDGERAGMVAGLMVSQDQKEAKDWFVQSAGNMITLQPLHEMPASVVSFGGVTADKQMRAYQFELCTRLGDITKRDDPDAYMTVRMRYPVQAAPVDPATAAATRARQVAARAAVQEASEARAVKTLFATASTGLRNRDYQKRDPKGCPVLTPTYPPGRDFIWDDGLRTTLSFPPHAVLPAVYVRNQDGKRSVVTTIATTTPQGTEIMLPSTYQYILLGRGGLVCELRNLRYDPIGFQPGMGTGTISPNVALEARP